MAKIQILGDAAVLTSAMTLEDLRTIAKYRPDALVLKGGEDGKEPVFRIIPNGTSNGSFTKNGVIFSGESRDGKKLAQLTMFIEGSSDDKIAEYVADKLGAGLSRLNELEATLPDVLESVKAERAAVMQSIEVVVGEPTCDCEQGFVEE